MEPTRRQFLRLGGATAVSALLLGACSDNNDAPGDAASSPAPTTTTTTTAPPAGPPVIDDLTLLRTMASLEALAIAAYGTLESIGLVRDPVILAIAQLHADHHQHHLDELNRLITQAGARRYTTPNVVMEKALVEPVLIHPRLAEADLVTMASQLEGTMAQGYTYATGVFSTPAMRSIGMAIGGVESRHAATIGAQLLKATPATLFPASLANAATPFPDRAIITG